jgi:hypothetical protein
MKTYQVASYSKKSIVLVNASSMARAAAAYLGVETAFKIMGDRRTWGNAKGKARTENVTVFTMEETVPSYFTRQ